MKASKTLMRPIILVATAILTIFTAVTCAVTFALATTPDAAIASYQVTMNGNLNLRFIYSSVDEGVEFTATVNEEEVTPKVTTEGTVTIVSVPVAPSCANDKIVVSTPKTSYSYSVADYVRDVLDDASLSEWHDSIRALANWCNHANSYFAETPSAIKDIFARNTDPVNAVGADSINAPTHSENTAKGQLALRLNKGNVSLVFKISNAESTANSLDVVIKREGMKDVSTKTYKDEGYHIVEINSITTSLFSKVYTVELADGNNTLTAYASVLEYLDLIIEGKSDAPTDEQTDTAKALYQFYQLTNTDTINAECTHTDASGVSSSYWVDEGEMHSCRCSYCYTEIDSVKSTVIDRYVSADMIASPVEKNRDPQNIPDLTDITPTRLFDFANGTLKYENGVQFYSFCNGAEDGIISQIIWNRAASGDGYDDWVTDGPYYNLNVGTAKYAVIKLRASDVSKISRIRLDIGTSNTNGLSRTALPLGMLTANEWSTFVIDLTKIYETSQTYLDKDGEYIIDSLVLNVDFTDNEALLDIASITFANDWTEVASITDTATVIKVDTFSKTTASAAGSIVKPDGSCVKHALEYTYTDVGAYTETCKVCGYGGASKNVTGYIGADHIYTRIVNKYTDNIILDPWYQRIDRFNAKSIKTDDVTCENGYISTTVNISFDQEIIWNKEETTATSYVNRTIDAGDARFLVLRMRVNSDGNDQNIFNFYLSTEGGKRKSTRIPYKSENKGKWVTYVFDMSEGLINPDNTTYTDWLTTTDDGRYVFDEIWIKFNQNANVDIEYMAFIRGNWSNVADFTGEETVVKLTHMYGENSVVVNSSTGIDVALTPEEE